MKYNNIHQATFRFRPNRFIAECELDGIKIEAHVRNTGRCKELLVPGCTVYLEKNPHPNRKTQYTLISVEKSGRVINMDSLAPNKVFFEAIQKGGLELPGFRYPYGILKSEKHYGDSRFDFYMENDSKKAFIEVKGVTLEEDGIVLFPDAPTERGVKHILELCKAKEEGYLAYLVFIVQMKGVQYLTPNRRTHSAFAEALELAQQSGVNLLSFDCLVSPDEIQLDEKVEIML
ncbi:DNA/RNA nuclease SfsA [Clostridium aminobutyricum]|uniref:Sugar fermentation stimulation protein homolog n=1 Tax=Clostridium aminobutyricum TaxID=33953 RepID=A0A939DAG3_CLOAM|nr:DNA/RNA nuclease SfsA [Clostridium aminobutyricum]MBN7774211.1 DNA/RNA nuclease SfsA [Clostridium aminobutyricum]